MQLGSEQRALVLSKAEPQKKEEYEDMLEDEERLLNSIY